MKKRKKILSDHSGMTLVEILTAFFILMLASKAVVSCISGYSRVIEKSRELSAAGTEVERLTGDAEYAAAAEIHLEIGGEEFVESGSYVEETVKDSDRPVTGFGRIRRSWRRFLQMENKRGGFTLVEVMTVILLFGMLMLLIFPMRRMMVRVLERTGDQEHAEMIGDAVFRHVADGLQTGAIRGGDLDELSLDAFCEDDLVPEISVEDSSGSRVFIRITVSEEARVLYERSGNIFVGAPDSSLK